VQRSSRFFSFLGDFPRILPYLRPYWVLALVSVVVLGLSVLAGLLAPWPLAILVDSVLGEKPLPSILGSLFASWDQHSLLLFAVFAGLGVTALTNGIAVIQEYVNTKLEQRMVLDFRSDLFANAQRLSPAYHERAQVGGLMFAFTQQAHALGNITVMIPPLVQSFATLIGMFVITYRIDSQLALLALAVVPFIYYSTGYYTNRIGPRLLHVRDLEHRQFSFIQEVLSMFRVVLAFGRERYEHKRFRDLGQTAVDARVDLTLRQTLFSLAVDLITATGTALVLGFGGYHALQGTLTVGELLVVLSYIAAVYAPLQQISYTLTTLQEEFIGLRMALDILDAEPDIRDAPDAIEMERARGAVAFQNVSFAYEGRAQTLTDISFEAQAGQRIAVVGPTGAGKSTMMALIARLYDPREGRILLDGFDLRSLTVKSLRRQISIVLQEPLLFSGTIEDNIRYGRLDASGYDVVEAAMAANAHAFIVSLPAGYATELGERGAQLSGGERQRISIARAFLKDAPILILDEPTSAIDTETEAAILDALDQLMVGRTTFVISHRVTGIRDADMVLVLDHGHLVEQGSPQELLRANGLFRRLYAIEGDQPEKTLESAVRDKLTSRLAKALNEPRDELEREVRTAFESNRRNERVRRRRSRRRGGSA
jgi:ATP-binding cassette, subfamily B, bacterial